MLMRGRLMVASLAVALLGIGVLGGTGVAANASSATNL